MQQSRGKAPSTNEEVAFQDDSIDISPDRHGSESSWEVVIDTGYTHSAIPASCVSEVTKPSLSRRFVGGPGPDLITRGKISLASAEHFALLYQQRLDRFLYRILIDRDSLASIRSSSPLLTAAVCTVGALHAQSSAYGTCYQEFMREYSTRMCSKKHNLDDVRGLCIGAFWLSDMSWALAGAVCIVR